MLLMLIISRSQVVVDLLVRSTSDLQLLEGQQRTDSFSLRCQDSRRAKNLKGHPWDHGTMGVVEGIKGLGRGPFKITSHMPTNDPATSHAVDWFSSSGKRHYRSRKQHRHCLLVVFAYVHNS